MVATGHKRVTFLAIDESYVELFSLSFIWDLKFLQRWIRGVLSSGMLKCVVAFKFSNLCDCVALQKTGFLCLLTFKNSASYIYRTGVPLPSRCCILYIFFPATISTEYFKHAAHSPFFSTKCRLFHNATFFGSSIIHILHTGCT